MKNKLLTYVLPVIVFFALIVAMTYPLIFKIRTCMPGFFSTDESFVIIWNAWRIKFAILNHLSLKTTDLIAYPFGINFYSSHFISYIWVLINYLLSVFTTPVLTYNIQVVMNFLLSAFFAYLLSLYLTKSRLAGLLSGIAFGFCPYIFIRSWQHLGETYIWPMPLFLWSLLRLKEDVRLRAKIIYILSLVLAAINYAVLYYTLIIAGVFFIFLLRRWSENKKYIKKIILLSLIAMILLLPQFWPVLKNIFFPQRNVASAWNVYQRPFEDLFMQSAKPLSYFLPSIAHPIFGKFTEQFVGSNLYGISFTEHTLYLGWVSLILAFVAFMRWKKNRKQATRLKQEDAGDYNFYVAYFIFLTIIAWLFSQPPWWNIGSIKILMPSYIMYKILPTFRAYCRFGVVVMFAIAALAGFGLKIILEKFKSRKIKYTVGILLCALILFEFWNWPSYKVIDVSRFPQAYYWLKAQQGNVIIAEYPLDITGSNEIYRLYQTLHEKKIINGINPNTKSHQFFKTLAKLSDPNTAGALKAMGVKYALVHRDSYSQTDLIEDKEELSNIPKNPGVRLIKSFPTQDCTQKGIMCIEKTGPIDVYEIIAFPAK